MYAFTQTSLKRKKYFTIKFNLWMIIIEDLFTPLFIGLRSQKWFWYVINKNESINISCNYFDGYKHFMRIIIVKKSM